MNKEEFKKHCEDQIERCIALNDYRHLKEHEISLALLNECEQRKQNQENLIKYIEDEIKEYSKFDTKKTMKQIEINTSVRLVYQDLLERIKSNNYENTKN